MSVLIAALLLAGDPTTTSAAPTAPAQAVPAPVKKAKPKQICETIEVTGSRSPKRVCHDERTEVVILPGVSNSGYGKAQIQNGGSSTTQATPQ